MLQATVNDQKTMTVSSEKGTWLIDNSPVSLDIQQQPNGLISVLFNGKSFTASVEKIDRAAKVLQIRVDGQLHSVAISEEIDLLLSKMGLDLKSAQKAEPVKAPMPGMILKVLVEPGQSIQKGDGLLILEAMKMENVLKANGPATVKSIRVNERTAVEKGAILIELE